MLVFSKAMVGVGIGVLVDVGVALGASVFDEAASSGSFRMSNNSKYTPP